MRPLWRPINLASMEGHCNLAMSLVQAYRLMEVMAAAMLAGSGFPLFCPVKGSNGR